MSKAAALAGGRAIVTGADLPPAEDRIVDLGEETANLKYMRDNMLATDRVLYKGHPVAAVAATSAHIAEEALALIEVDYEVRPAVTEVRARVTAVVCTYQTVTPVVAGAARAHSTLR